MYKIILYERTNGKIPVKDFIESYKNDNKTKDIYLYRAFKSLWF